MEKLHHWLVVVYVYWTFVKLLFVGFPKPSASVQHTRHTSVLDMCKLHAVGPLEDAARSHVQKSVPSKRKAAKGMLASHSNAAGKFAFLREVQKTAIPLRSGPLSHWDARVSGPFSDGNV